MSNDSDEFRLLLGPIRHPGGPRLVGEDEEFRILMAVRTVRAQPVDRASRLLRQPVGAGRQEGRLHRCAGRCGGRSTFGPTVLAALPSRRLDIFRHPYVRGQGASRPSRMRRASRNFLASRGKPSAAVRAFE